MVEKHNFNDKVVHQNKDIVLFLFSSQYSADTDKSLGNHIFADVFIDVKNKFAIEKINTVKFYAIDLNLNQNIIELGRWNEAEETPMFLMLPAEHKMMRSAPRYYGKVIGRDFARYVHKNADYKFQFSDKLHGVFVDDMTNIPYVNSPEDSRIEDVEADG